ncbi:MAG: right-handed parallel beta-helix repeat-containing protein [Blastocatellales bacterium]
MTRTHKHTHIASILRFIKVWHLLFVAALALAAAMLAGPGIRLTRPVKAASTFFVRTDGSNASCNGLSNASSASAPNCAFQTIQFAVTTAASGDTINVGAGVFIEDVAINKTLIVSGSGVANTTVSGPIGGAGSTFAVSANNVELKNFKITREGNNTTDWNSALNTAGVSIIGTALTGMNVHDNLITQNRTGIDVNNSSGHTIRNNVITDNHTGMIFRNVTDNETVVENEITLNRTVGVLFLDASGGTNVPLQTALNCAFFNNNISGNWYGQIVDRQTGGSLPTPGTTNLKNFSGNWFGTNAPVITTANSAEPGYSVHIPVAFGGTATPPGGQPDVLGPASANFDITPLLETGVDTDVETTLGRGVYGFQGNFNNLRVILAGAQIGSGGRIQEGVNLTGAGGTVNVNAGAFTELVTVNKSITLQGAQAGIDARTRVAASESIVTGDSGKTAFYLTANNVVIDGFTVQGQTNTNVFGAGIYFGAGTSGAHLLNNIIQNNVVGLFLSNATGGAQAVIQRNLFSANNQPGAASGSGIYSDQFVAGGAVDNVLIDNNKFTGHAVGGAGINLSSTSNGSQSNVAISNNEFAADARAMVLFNVVSSSITGNYIHGSTWAASADLRIFEGNNNLTITGNTLVGGAGHALRISDIGTGAASAANITVNCNRIVNYGLTGATVDAGAYTGTLNLENNWWGCNAGPGGAGCNTVSGAADFNPWLTLALAAAPPNPVVGGTSTLTASLKMNSNGVLAPCTVPDGTPVAFAGTGGTVNPANTATSGGMAMSTYTAGNTPGAFSASTTVDNQTVSTVINVTTAPAITCPADITVGSDAGKNTASVAFTAPATGSPAPTVTCKVGSTTITSPHNFPIGTTTVNCTATNGVAPDATCSFKVTVDKVSASLSDPLACTGPGNTVTGTITIANNGNATANAVADTALPAGLLALPGTCVASVGTCSVINASQISYTGAIPAGQTATITYLAQVGDQVTNGTQLCATTEVSLDGGPKSNAQACVTVTCPAVGPGSIPDAKSPVSDQKAGSVLIYNLYTSSASSPNAQNTRISLTNVHGALSARVHLFFVDGSNCSVADNYVCLTPNQTTSFLASDLDPGSTGYIVAVAVDDHGCPVNFNYLIGDEYVKLESGHAANLGAEAFSAIAGGLPRCDDSSATAELKFDGASYSQAPRVLALSNIASRADGNDTLLVLNRVGGNLATGAATLTDIFGIFYDDAETGVSFSFNPKVCQFRANISNNFPRIAPRFETLVPSGRSGWLKLYSTSDQGILGAAINFNQNSEGSAGAFSQGHNLHKLTLTSGAVYTIPVFPPSC